MKNLYDKILLSWRSAIGKRRIIIGELTLNRDSISFEYKKKGVQEAKKQGFVGYPGLSLETEQHSDVQNIFYKRLVDSSRSDLEPLFNFWKIDEQYKDDKWYMLAMTQGKMQTDNFEFLAVFKMGESLSFVTDIAGISYADKPITLNKGLNLSFVLETENEYDPKAVRIEYNATKIGYIKKGHNEVFHAKGADRIKLKIVEIINTNQQKQVFVHVYC